ncbi:SurA N-terminal domain-containing protein [Pseudochrobactrum sp. sp1633]|uniref:SurA N-terminal domain-containing protein n=1 Tax=Pseudochrobactrum sp. sp1633 TaxID=3036706 RepID=UPI0025A554A1|nr:SurA N-terminal domain-containing protein [Pseudochrobactrum sp. sp1633]MDM8344704.1 SurA N-terminal domain-containing protein [Pseudochrobactrum sp. sp1633]HWD13536.1 SurA N-terminal domain-containing protein [Pseudochrobactrum sp.]
MLDSLRTASKSWVSKFFLGLLVLSFAAWGIADVFREGFSGNAVLEAGGSSVSPTEYRLAYDRQVIAVSNQLRQQLTRDQAKALGIPSQVTGQLVAGVLLDEQARTMGLGMSKDHLARLTGEDQAFQDSSGRFSSNQFNAVLRQAGMSPQDYFDSRTKFALRQQIVEAVSDGMSAPDTLFKALALYDGESRTIDYITLTQEKADTIATPDDAELKKWYEANLGNYRAPEYRKVSYVPLEAQSIANESDVTPEEIQDYYKKNVARFSTEEKRTIEQLNFANEDEAKAAAEKIKSGTSFADLVTQSGKKPDDVKLGTFVKADLPDAVIADAAFALPANGTSDVVKGAFGPVLLHISAVEPSVVKTEAEVEPEIRKTLALTQALSSLNAVHDSYEEERGNGATLAQAAEKLKLQVKTIEAVDAEGNGLDGKPVADLPQLPSFLTSVYQSDQGIDNDALPTPTRGYIWYQLDGVTPARDRSFDEVKDRVTAEWKQDQATKRLTAKAEDLRKRLEAGEALDVLAQEAGTEKQTKRGLTRTATDSELAPSAIAQIFGGSDNLSGVASGINKDTQILFKVTETTEPAGVSAESLPEGTRTAISSRIGDDLLEQLVGRLQGEYPVKINQTLMDQALSF